jgi:hypothetical protein
VASDRMGQYMLKKCSGTRNENACASIAEKKEDSNSEPRRRRSNEAEALDQRRTPKVDVEVLQAAEERFRGRRRESLEELLCQAYFRSEKCEERGLTDVGVRETKRQRGEVTYRQ